MWSQEYLEWIGGVWNSKTLEEMAKQFLSANFYSVSMSDENLKNDIQVITKENLKKFLTWETFEVPNVRWFHPDANIKLNQLRVPVPFSYQAIK